MMENNQIKARTVTIINPMCQTCSKRYTCNNKTFVNCFVPETYQESPIPDTISTGIKLESMKNTITNGVKIDFDPIVRAINQAVNNIDWTKLNMISNEMNMEVNNCEKKQKNYY